MSCVTCEVTPPPEKLAPEPVGAHHVGVRFGHYGLGWAVYYRGHDVTLQCVEALAGDEDTGWVEMRTVNSEGAPTIHRDDNGNPDHHVTVIRRGAVQIAHGAQVIANGD